MSISDTIGQASAANPAVGAAASDANVKNAIVVGMQTGNTAIAGLLGALSAQALQTNTLLSSLSGLGQKVNLKA